MDRGWDAPSPTRVPGYAMRTYSGRPRSLQRFPDPAPHPGFHTVGYGEPAVVEQHMVVRAETEEVRKCVGPVMRTPKRPDVSRLGIRTALTFKPCATSRGGSAGRSW